MINLKRCWILKICQKEFGVKYFKVNFRSWNIVFFGSDKFSIISLKKLLNECKRINKVEVVTSNVNTLLYKFSKENDIQVNVWPPKLYGIHDIGVVVSFGKFIPKTLIEFFPLGIINVHASLLPKWRGAMPIVYSIKNGDVISGITIQKIKADAFDTGDIIMQRICYLGKNELYPSAHAKLAKLGAECLLEVIQDLPHSLINCKSQVENDVSYARKLKKDVAFVRWSNLTAIEVYNLYRALFSVYDLITMWKGNQVKLICMSIPEIERKDELSFPGSISYDKKSQFLLVNCKDKPIQLCTVMIKGKLYIAKQFYKGYLGSLDKKHWFFEDI